MDISPHSSNNPFHPPKASEPFYRQTRVWLIILGCLILIIISQHFPFSSKTKKPPAIPVLVSKAIISNVPVYLSELGSVIPISTITVRTQINGQLTQVLFREGQMVKKGDLLATIDSRPYQAQLAQYQGQLLRDQALLKNAQVDQVRYQNLWKQDSISRQTLDTQSALVDQYRGAIQIDAGLIQATQVNLAYCNIISPIDGQIGLRLVDPGNYVQISDLTGIAVVDSLSPINVLFSIPEDSVQEVLEQINTGHTLAVKVFNRQQTQLLASGTLLTMDNQIDPNTGTVKLKATFNNTNHVLFPNQFVNALLLVTTLQNVTTIPTAAIQHGTNANYVYVLNSDDTVSVKAIVIGPGFGGNTTVKSGITPGQSVVTEGTDKLSEGTLVKVADETHSPQTVASSRAK